MNTPDLQKALKHIRRARDLSFRFGFVVLVGAFVGVFVILNIRDKGMSPIYNQVWVKERFAQAVTPEDKDKVIYKLLDVIATTDHFYWAGGFLILAMAMVTCIFAFGFYRSASAAVAELEGRE